MSTKLSLKRPARRRLHKLDRKNPSADVRVRIRGILKKLCCVRPRGTDLLV